MLMNKYERSEKKKEKENEVIINEEEMREV
jgi:hypothetical protein